jgi:hypothetical protein
LLSGTFHEFGGETITEFTVNEPTGAAVGDRLVVLGSSYSNAMISTTGNWTNIGTIAGGSMTAYSRIKDGTSDDVYTLPARAGPDLANIYQVGMIALPTFHESHAGLVAGLAQNSVTGNGLQTDMELDAIASTASTAPEIVIAQYGFFVAHSSDAGAPNFTDPSDDFVLINNYADYANISQWNYFWGGCAYKLTTNGEAVSGQVLTHAPTGFDANHRKETFRFTWT